MIRPFNRAISKFFACASLALVFNFSTIAIAQSTETLAPVVNLLLNEQGSLTEFTCEFSISDVFPAPGSTIAENESVSANFNYTLNNRPEGIIVEVRPNIITSLEDLDNFQSTSALSLNPILTTLADNESTESDISGTIQIERTNDGNNIGLTGRTFNDLVVFITLSRQDPDSEATVIIGSGAFNCENRVSETVNWFFTRDTQ